MSFCFMAKKDNFKQRLLLWLLDPFNWYVAGICTHIMTSSRIYFWGKKLVDVMCLCVCIHTYTRVGFRPFFIPLEMGRVWVGFKLWMQIDQADFADWKSFISSNLMEEISANSRSLQCNYLNKAFNPFMHNFVK